MNRFLNIIPTPKFCEYNPGNPLSLSKLCVIGQVAPVLQYALDALEGVTLCPNTKLKNSPLTGIASVWVQSFATCCTGIW